MPWVRVAWWTLSGPEGSSGIYSGKRVHCIWQGSQLMQGTDPSSLLSPVKYIWITVSSAGFISTKEHSGVRSAKVPWRLLRRWGVSGIRKGWDNWVFLTWGTEDSGEFITIYIYPVGEKKTDLIVVSRTGIMTTCIHTGIQEIPSKQKNLFSYAGAQTLEQAAKGGSGAPILKGGFNPKWMEPEQPAVGRSGTGLQSCHPASAPPQFHAAVPSQSTTF